MANKIRQQKQVRLGSQIYKLLNKKKEENKKKPQKKQTRKKTAKKHPQSTQCFTETLGRETK